MLARRCQPWLLLVLMGCSEYEVVESGKVDLLRQGGEEPRTDVVFVVDDSASMAEEQAQLQVAFSGFVDVLLDTEADFQLVVTTTDPAGDAASQGPPLTADTADLSTAILEQFDVGTGGGRDEQGYMRAVQALRSGALPARPDARLVVIFFSDEDDHSAGPVSGYLDELSLYAGSGEVDVHAIVGDLPGGCASGLSAADPAPRYIEGAGLSLGYSASICSDDYAQLFEDVGFAVTGWNDSFPLTRLPEPDSITVRVDEVLIPRRDTDGWSWSIGDNAILFTGRAIPRPGMDVEIRYEVSEGQLSGAAGDTGR